MSKALFLPNPGRPSPKPVVVNTTDAMELYENVVLNRRMRADWEMDFSSTYLLHGFSMSSYGDWINPKTLLSRTSNFGVATYDVVKQMKEDGIITGNEDGKEPLPVPDRHDLNHATNQTGTLLVDPSSPPIPLEEAPTEIMEADF